MRSHGHCGLVSDDAIQVRPNPLCLGVLTLAAAVATLLHLKGPRYHADILYIPPLL